MFNDRDRTSTKIPPKKPHHKCYEICCSSVCIIYLFDTQVKHDFVFEGETPACKYRRKAFLPVDYQVCTHLKRDFGTLLFTDLL